MRVRGGRDLRSSISDLRFYHFRRVILGVRLDLLQQTGVIDGVVAQFVPLGGELVPFRFAPFPLKPTSVYEECSTQVIFLQNWADNIQVGV